RRTFERTRSKVPGKPERAPALMRRSPSHRHGDAKARGYYVVFPTPKKKRAALACRPFSFRDA
ncbi:hypothetical protein, partial [Methylobacterium frigidaeris]